MMAPNEMGTLFRDYHNLALSLEPASKAHIEGRKKASWK